MEDLVNAFRGRRVLVTGHRGFKGTWLSIWLRELGADVAGYALPTRQDELGALMPSSVWTGEWFGDVADGVAFESVLREFRPELVMHLAAQALVRSSYENPLGTLRSNVMGTAEVLDAVRRVGAPCAVLVITSDKCYENREWEHGYRETDRLGGRDPYSMSKAVSELVTASWKASFLDAPERGILVGSARGGNVIGGGDMSRDRIVPDLVRGRLAGTPVVIRNPRAVRPWQHVLDCLSGYLVISAALLRGDRVAARPFNVGPDAADRRTVGELVREFEAGWPGGHVERPDTDAPHEATLLHLTTDRLRVSLGWRPRWDFREAVARTAGWYRRHVVQGADARELCLADLRAYAATPPKP